MATQVERLQAAIAGRYEIERELGRGGMATVYLARDLKHDRHVAIKVLLPDVAVALGAERFKREIGIATKFSHPHVLPLYDSGEADGSLFYVMPYIEGESLRDKLDREKQLSVPEAVRIAAEVADALDYAHRQGVIHRDIKPENVLLEDGHALLADFGIARAAEATGAEKLTQTGVTLGTPVYMSPEQAMADKNIDARADIYSLGCLLYEMLSGNPPFGGPTAQAILARHALDQVPLLTIVRASMFLSAIACSGLMYTGVPSVTPVCVSFSAPDASAARAMPKSARSAWPSSSRTFSGLMSRWITPWRCA